MLNNIYKLLVFLCFVIPYFPKAQTPDKNLVKYWHYRERLKNDFILGIGDDFGMSLPASSRNVNSGVIKWGDATVHHASYIGVLATEYYLLNQIGENTASTVEELYWAIHTLDRLDFNAEYFFGGDPNLNGFFIRDDVTPETWNMSGYVIPHLNQDLPTPVINSFASDFLSINATDKEMSQDQVLQLMWGLGLIIKYVPDDVEYVLGGVTQHFATGTASLKEEAKNIVNRFVNYMRIGDSWNWTIYNPVTGIPVARGPDAFTLSAGFAGAKFFLTHETTPTSDFVHANIADNIFKGFADYWVINDQDFKVIMLDAMANYWPDGVTVDDSNNEFNAIIIGPRCTTNPYNSNWTYEFVTLYHQALHGGGNYLGHVPVKDYFEDQLNQAPCIGPYNYSSGGTPNYYSYEWSSGSRTLHPDERGSTSPADPGDYNGLDYMITHNLYRIVYKDLLPPFINRNIANVHFDFPYSCSTGLIGDDSNPYSIEALSTITADNHINSAGDVTYRSGKSITLTPGFIASTGSDFRAYIDPLECDGNEFRIFEPTKVVQKSSSEMTSTLITQNPANPIKVPPLASPSTSFFKVNNDCSKCYWFDSKGFDQEAVFVISTFDTSGKLVDTRSVSTSKTSINFENLSTGLYITQVSCNDYRKSYKVIIGN